MYAGVHFICFEETQEAFEKKYTRKRVYNFVARLFIKSLLKGNGEREERRPRFIKYLKEACERQAWEPIGFREQVHKASFLAGVTRPVGTRLPSHLVKPRVRFDRRSDFRASGAAREVSREKK